MKFKVGKTLYLLGVAGFAGCLLLLSAPHANAGEPFHGKTIVGTWHVDVQLHTCDASAAPMGKPFAALLTFASGGTMSGSTSNSAFAVGQRSSDQGIWSFRGWRKYQAKQAAFIFYTTPPIPPVTMGGPPVSPGFNAGVQTISQDIEFKNGPDEFNSEAQIDFADETGAVYRHACATAVAQRFE